MQTENPRTGERELGYWVWAVPRWHGDGVSAPQRFFLTRAEALTWARSERERCPRGRRLVVRRAAVPAADGVAD